MNLHSSVSDCEAGCLLIANILHGSAQMRVQPGWTLATSSLSAVIFFGVVWTLFFFFFFFFFFFLGYFFFFGFVLFSLLQ